MRSRSTLRKRSRALGTYRNNDGSVFFIASLVVDGTEYRAETIRDHYAEVQVLLDRERTERLLEEIEW